MPWMRWVGRKAGRALFLVWLVVSVVFVLIDLSPVDAADHYADPGLGSTPMRVEAIRAAWHLDDPAPARYLAALRNLATLQLGHSFRGSRPVAEVLRERLPYTLVLSGSALVFMFLVGVGVGALQVLRRRRALDHLLGGVSLFLYAMPDFWLGLLLLWLASLLLSGGPPTGACPVTEFGDGGLCLRWRHLLLPSLALGIPGAAVVARHTRSALLEVLEQDYIRTARAKGAGELRVLLRHALPNALLPLISLLGLYLPWLFSGSVVIERVFLWPGMGDLLVRAIFDYETGVLLAAMFVYTLLVTGGNLLADLLYAVVDPRVRVA